MAAWWFGDNHRYQVFISEFRETRDVHRTPAHGWEYFAALPIELNTHSTGVYFLLPA
jgi:hypothetical protein